MGCTITDQIVSFNPDGTSIGRSGLTIYAYPETNALLRKDSGGVYRPIQQNIALPAEAQWGTASQLTDSDGDYSILIPRGDEQLPATTRWFIQLPDGKRYRGVPPNNSGPLTIYDLDITHGWELVDGQMMVDASSDGREASGEVTMTGQEYYDAVFSTEMESSSYTLSVSFQADTAVGGAPGWNWSNRSKTGVRINFTQAYNGILAWRAQVE